MDYSDNDTTYTYESSDNESCESYDKIDQLVVSDTTSSKRYVKKFITDMLDEYSELLRGYLNLNDALHTIYTDNHCGMEKLLIDTTLRLIDANIDVMHDNHLYDAIEHGFLRFAKMLKEHGHPVEQGLYEAAKGSLGKYKFIYEDLGLHDEGAIGDALCIGSIECFEYLVSKGVAVSKIEATQVLFSNDLEVIEYIAASNYGWYEGFPIDDIYGLDVSWKYCHDNHIPKRWECDKDCVLCSQLKVEKK